MNKVNRIFMSLLRKKETSRLPSGYTELEYITNAGSAYLNTGVRVSDGDVITMHIENVSTSATSFVPMFGTYTRFDNNTHRLVHYFDGVGRTWQIRWGTNAQNWTPQNAPQTNVTFDFVWQNGTQSNSVTDGFITINFTSALSANAPLGEIPDIYVFAYNNNGSVSGYFPGSIGEFILYQNDTIRFDLVPAMRNSDSVVGMYDLVSNTFKTSLSSDPFVAGPVKQL